DPREVKVVRNKPAGAVDSCYIGTEKVTDQSKCRPLFPYFGTTRIAAGGPLANDVMRCELTPLNRLDYLPVTFTDEQWAPLRPASRRTSRCGSSSTARLSARSSRSPSSPAAPAGL